MAGQHSQTVDSSKWDVVKTWLSEPAAKQQGKRAVCALCKGKLVVAGLERQGLAMRIEWEIFSAAASRETGPEAGLVLVCGCMIGHKCFATWASGASGASTDSCPSCSEKLQFRMCPHTVPPILAPLFAQDSRRRVPSLPYYPTLYPLRCVPCKAKYDAGVKYMLDKDVWEPESVDELQIPVPDTPAVPEQKDFPKWGDEGNDDPLARSRHLFRRRFSLPAWSDAS